MIAEGKIPVPVYPARNGPNFPWLQLRYPAHERLLAKLHQAQRCRIGSWLHDLIISEHPINVLDERPS